MEIHRVTEWYKLENCKGLSKRENKNPLNSLTLSYSSVIIFRQRFHFMPIFTGSFFPSAFQSYFLFYYEFQCFASYLLHFFSHSTYCFLSYFWQFSWSLVFAFFFLYLFLFPSIIIIIMLTVFLSLPTFQLPSFSKLNGSLTQVLFPYRVLNDDVLFELFLLQDVSNHFNYSQNAFLPWFRTLGILKDDVTNNNYNNKDNNDE